MHDGYILLVAIQPLIQGLAFSDEVYKEPRMMILDRLNVSVPPSEQCDLRFVIRLLAHVPDPEVLGVVLFEHVDYALNIIPIYLGEELTRWVAHRYDPRRNVGEVKVIAVLLVPNPLAGNNILHFVKHFDNN